MTKELEKKIWKAVTILVLLFVVGMIGFMTLEGWNWVDAFYFVGVTITTIGYGNVAPATPAGKIFTVFFAIFGVSLSIYVFTIIAEAYMEQKLSLFIKLPQERIKTRMAEMMGNGKEKTATEEGEFTEKDGPNLDT